MPEASATMKVYEILSGNPQWFLISRNVSFIYASEGGRAKSLEAFVRGEIARVLEEENDPRLDHLESKDIDWAAIVRHLRTMGNPYRAEVDK